MRLLSYALLAAVLAPPAPVLAQAGKDAAASPAVQKEFNGFIAKFRTALKANDAAAVAGMAQLPFQNDNSVGNAAQFRAKIYQDDFTAKTRACIQRGQAVYARDGDKNDTYSILCGERIFVFTKMPAGFLLTDIGMND